MNTITFTNNSTKLNADTMNSFQSNIKAAIDDNTNKINKVNTTLTNKINSSIVGNNNYIQLIDGTQICFGKITLSNLLSPKHTTITVKLPNAFKTADYTVIITKFQGEGNFSHVIEEVRSLTTSSFEIHTWNDLEQTAEIKGYMYIAIGKYK